MRRRIASSKVRLPLLGAVSLAAVALAGPALAQSGTGAPGDDLVAKGKYLAEAADCMPCHTGPGGKPFAGGLMLDTPFGGIASANITPDEETGIGSWTEEQFFGALHDGFAADGSYLYPAMPFTSYTKIVPEDAKAIFAYLKTVEPVNVPPVANTLSFPFNVRASLSVWRAMFFTPGAFVPNASAPEDINRGAYLVEGLGHCGECHTPRNVMGAMEGSKDLGGAAIDTFFAPNISSDLRAGIGGWTEDQLYDYLKQGADKTKGTVFGPMAEVVHDSLSKLADSDIRAIIAYLKATPEQLPPKPEADPRKAEGATVYLNVCSQCHHPDGKGIAGAVPPLANNGAVTAAGPEDVISAVLGGLDGQGSYGQMPSFAATFDDQQVADVVNYVRTAWGNHGPADATPAMVAALRTQLVPTGLGDQAAAAFDCPAVSTLGTSGSLTSPGSGILQLMQGVQPQELLQRIDEIIAALKQANPDESNADLTDDVIAAYCPILAADSALSDAQKAQRLDQFQSAVTNALGQGAMPASAQILVRVEVAPADGQAIAAAAAAAKEPIRKWLAATIAEAAAKPPAGGAAPVIQSTADAKLGLPDTVFFDVALPQSVLTKADAAAAAAGLTQDGWIAKTVEDAAKAGAK